MAPRKKAGSVTRRAASGIKGRPKVKGKPRGKPFQKGHTVGRRFKKGESGNPSGRPPVPAEHLAAMNHLEPLGYQAFEDILLDPSHKDRAHVAEYVTNRKHGKPIERKEVTGSGGAPLVSPTVENALGVLRRLVGAGKLPSEE